MSCHWWLSEKNENRQTAVLQLEERSKKMVLRGFCAPFVDREARNCYRVKFTHAVPVSRRMWVYSIGSKAQ